MAVIKLHKAYLFNRDGNDADPVVVMFNPEKVTINKTVPWKAEQKAKEEVPKLQFTGIQGRSLKVDLDFDTSGDSGDGPDATDVNETITKILAMTSYKSRKDPEKKEPPTVDFGWGKDTSMSITGKIKTCNVTYTRFNPDGVPTRAKVQLEITEAPPTGKAGKAPPEGPDVRADRLSAGRS